MMQAAPSAIGVATALFVSTFNIGIALGSLAGGQIVDRFDLHTNLLLAAVLPALGLLFAVVIRKHAARIAEKSTATGPAIEKEI